MSPGPNQGGLKVQMSSLLDPKASVPPGVGGAPSALRAARGMVPSKVGEAFSETASALQNHQTVLDRILAVLRRPPEVQRVYVTDGAGKVIAALGDFIFPGSGIRGRNYFSELHVGDPLGTGDPEHAVFNANPDGSVVIGQNGWIDVLDPFGGHAAWIGTQSDTLPVTGASNNGSGEIRLEVLNHTLKTGDQTTVYLLPGDLTDIGPEGISNATGIWTVTKIDADHLDLNNSVFVGTYTSGGTVNRVQHIQGFADNGAGLIRVYLPNHGYESGDQVNLHGTGILGPDDTQWVISVPTLGGPLLPDPDHFDLLGSSYLGGYSLGTVLRYFAGGLFQTIAIGPSFEDYRLRAFADGTLKIRNAEIIDIATDSFGNITGEIIIDPTVPDIKVISFDPLTHLPVAQVDIQPGIIFIQTTDGAGNPLDPSVALTANQIRMFDALDNVVVRLSSTGNAGTINVTNDDGTKHVDLTGADGNVLATHDIHAEHDLIADHDVTAGHFVDAAEESRAGTFFRAQGAAGVNTTLHCLSAAPVVNTASAVTSVSGVGVTFSTGTFVTSISFALVDHIVTGGIVTS